MKSENYLSRLLILAACLAAVTGCARREEPDDVAASDDSGASTPTASSEPAPPPVVNGVHVDVSLSPDARARLESLSGSISVETKFVGDPTANSLGAANELGMIELGQSTVDLPTAGRASFSEDLIDRSKLDMIVGQPQVMVNTTSAGPNVPRDLLACTYFWETLSVAGETPIQVACSLASSEK